MVCGLGDHAQPCSITDTRTPSWLLHSAADILPNHGGVAAEIKFDFGPRIYHHIYINAVVAHRRPSSPAASTPPSRAASFTSPQVFSFSQVPLCTPHSDRITSTVSQGSVPRAHLSSIYSKTYTEVSDPNAANLSLIASPLACILHVVSSAAGRALACV